MLAEKTREERVAELFEQCSAAVEVIGGYVDDHAHGGEEAQVVRVAEVFALADKLRGAAEFVARMSLKEVVAREGVGVWGLSVPGLPPVKVKEADFSEDEKIAAFALRWFELEGIALKVYRMGQTLPTYSEHVCDGSPLAYWIGDRRGA